MLKPYKQLYLNTRANENAVKRIEAQSERIKELEKELARQKRDFEERVEAWEQATKQDIEDYKIVPKIMSATTIAACVIFMITALLNMSILQALGLHNEVLFLAGSACFFACFSCTLTFALARTKQHAIDYLQHLKTPQKHV